MWSTVFLSTVVTKTADLSLSGYVPGLLQATDQQVTCLQKWQLRIVVRMFCTENIRSWSCVGHNSETVGAIPAVPYFSQFSTTVSISLQPPFPLRSTREQ